MKKSHFPALTQSSHLRYLTLTALYMAQGLPYGFLIVALPAYFAQQGIEQAAISSYIAVAILPGTLKLLNGPIMDRWSYLPMGRRRPWVLFGQCGLIMSFVFIAFMPDATENLNWYMAAGFTVYIFTMFQDVATDGMAIDVVPVEEQARANGFMWGGIMVGISGATAGSSWMLNTYGLDTTALVAAGLVAFIMCFPLFLRERPGERLLPWTRGRASETTVHLQLHGWKDIGRSLFRVLILPASLLGAGAFFLYRIGIGINVGALPVMAVQELGWADTDYANLSATANLIGGLIGMILGGTLVTWLGRKRAIAVFGCGIAAAALMMGLFPVLWSQGVMFPSYIVLYLMLDVLVGIAFLALSMALCGQRVAATQFALYMAVSNLGLSAGSSLVGPLEATFGYQGVFMALAGLMGTGFVLLRFLNLERHRDQLRRMGNVEPDVEGKSEEITVSDS